MSDDGIFWREVAPFIVGCLLAGLIIAVISSESYHRWRFIEKCDDRHERSVCEAMWDRAQD